MATAKRAAGEDPSTLQGNEGPAAYPAEGARDIDYARYARAFWDEQTDALRPLHNTWQQNLLFLVGRHWWKLNENGRFEREIAPEWAEQPVTNFCLSFFKNFLAKVTKTRPAWIVVPASTEPSDMQAAQLGDEVLQAKFTELKVGKRWRRACAWTIATGNAYLLPFYSRDTGRVKELVVDVEAPIYGEGGEPTGETEILPCPCDETGEPMLDERGRPRTDAKPHAVDEGDVDFRVLSPFAVRVNADAEGDEEVRCFVVGEPTLMREIERRWPHAKGLVKAEDTEQIEYANQALSGMLSSGGNSYHASPRDQRDLDLPKALVLYYYERPSPEYPKGRHWVSAGDVRLTEPGPLPDGFLPLIHLTDVIVPGRYHAMSTLEAVVELNRGYNTKNAKIREHENLFLGGKWLIPRNSQIRKTDITTEPGECITYAWPYKPEMARMEPLPASVFQERDRFMLDFENISGIRQASTGGAPPGVTAGVAIAQLQEADDTDLSPFLAMGEEAHAELAGRFLQMIQRNYKDERIFYAAGPTRRYMVKSFKGADLTGAIDVIPQVGSSFALGIAARQQLILELVGTPAGMELFKDPETGTLDSGKLARLIQIGGLESLYETEDIDIQEALREEEAFSELGSDAIAAMQAQMVEAQMNPLAIPGQGGVPQVAPWQNHEIHYRQHRRTLAGEEWKKWPEPAQVAFLQHFAMTVAARDAARTRMMMQTAGVDPNQVAPDAPQGAVEGGMAPMGPTDPMMAAMLAGQGLMAIPGQQAGLGIDPTEVLDEPGIPGIPVF